MTQPPTSWGPQGPSDGSAPVAGEPARPGAVFPLRRMSLGELLGGGTAMLRHAPKAVLGLPLLAGLVTFLLLMIVQVLFPTPLAGLQNPMMMGTWSEDRMVAELVDAIPYYSATLAVGILQNLLLVVGFALIVLPTMRAAWGWRTEFLQTLTLRRDRIWPLIGTVVLLGIMMTLAMLVSVAVAVLITAVTFGIGGLLALPALLLLALWLTAGLMYAPLTVLVERRGPMQAIARSWSLNTGRWWATIGIVALVMLITIVISLILGLVAGLIGAVGAGTSISPGGLTEPSVGSTISMALSTLITTLSSSLVTALLGAVVAVMYLDARCRREGLDVTLMAAAEGAHDDGGTVPGSVEHVGAPRPVDQEPHRPGQPYQPDQLHQQGPARPGPYGQQDPYGWSAPYGQFGSSGQYGQPGQPGPSEGPGHRDDGGPARPQ